MGGRGEEEGGDRVAACRTRDICNLLSTIRNRRLIADFQKQLER